MSSAHMAATPRAAYQLSESLRTIQTVMKWGVARRQTAVFMLGSNQLPKELKSFALPNELMMWCPTPTWRLPQKEHTSFMDAAKGLVGRRACAKR